MDKGRKLGIDPRHEPVWDALEGLRSSAVVAKARAYASQGHEGRVRKRGVWSNLLSFSPMSVAAVAACLALIVGAGWWLRAPDALEYATHIGEIRTEKLADGSSIVLDTDTQIRVVFTGRARQLTLVRGQAHFDVAHDASRPFKVTFGKGTVTAIGTSFDVTAFANSKTVTLLGGRVVVEGSAKPFAHADQAMLSPGQRIALAPDGGLTVPSTIDLEGASSWRRGRIDLANLTLSDALAQVNRYSSTKIIVQEPSLSNRRLSGIFRAGDVDGIAAALCAYFDLKVVQRTPEAIIIAKSS
ncbi:FecR family protein [Sphingobium estronivorans]|uniref:FecR family protein n=1 Tax=Sphingobium estronivorans TaxID=1577690 RepID=UPI001239275A|nr:FecR domain-containing protein [Sphingobium estronivorans]